MTSDATFAVLFKTFMIINFLRLYSQGYRSFDTSLLWPEYWIYDKTVKLIPQFMAYMFSMPMQICLCVLFKQYFSRGAVLFLYTFMCVSWILCWHALAWICFDRSFTMGFFYCSFTLKKNPAKLFVYFVADLFECGLAVVELFMHENIHR